MNLLLSAEALDAALGTVAVVAKRRRVFLWEGVRIHLDEVEGLGSFIEFEAVLPDAGDLDTARAKVARLRTELGIPDDALVAVGYADVSMIRPRNWTSRWLSSLVTVSIAAVKVPAVTVVPLIVMWPVTALVRPTATWFCPNSTSITR